MRVFRYTVPVDDRPHEIELNGPIVHVATRGIDYVEFWSERYETRLRRRRFQVFGTGHDVPPRAKHIGSVVLHFGPQLVWHLYELEAAAK